MNYKRSVCLIFVLNLFGLIKMKKFRCTDDLTEQIKPLILTPLINDGLFMDAQSKAFVNLDDFKDIISYSGYFQVSKRYNSNLFFWYFPAQSNPEGAPLILWLQGGPGVTSIVGIFTETGPFELRSKFELKFRTYSWTKQYSVIYMDNPVGTGYSFTNSDGYAQNQTIIAKHLYDAMRQFFKLFPKSSRNDFYLAGEAYGGKYVIKLAELIYNMNASKKKRKMRLRGLLIGSGFCDPINQLNYGDTLYSAGLIDVADRQKFNYLEDCIKDFIKNGTWDKAYEIFDNLISGDEHNGTLYQNLTGLDNYHNYLLESGAHDHLPLIDYYAGLDDMRRAIHVGKVHFTVTSPLVEEHLKNDMMQSVADAIPLLLSHYKVMFYSAQLDVLVSYANVESFLDKLEFPNATIYRTSKRCIWRMNDIVAGYVKSWGNLTHVMLRKTGHRIPTDQPRFAYNMLQRFINNVDICS